MATTYPDSIQNFPTMQNISSSDATLVMQYQQAMKDGNVSLANSILIQIPNYLTKLISADFMNTIDDTLNALQEEYNKRYNPSITVSANAPATPQINDYWWKVI